jgi:hypothetical protein
MLCYRKCAGSLLGGCFAVVTVVARSSLTDALPPLLLDAGSLGACFATMVWSIAKETIALLHPFSYRLN